MIADVLAGQEQAWLEQADALDVLRGLPDGCADAIITDPPYSDVTHAGARTTRPGMGLTVVPIITFDSISGDGFVAFCRECVRVARRWVVMTCDWHHAVRVEAAMPAEFIRCGVWVKPDAAPQFTGDRPGTGWEAVLMLHRRGRKRWNNGGHHAVWVCGVERDNVHPTQKPLSLTRKWVKAFTDPGDLVLDPFAGSATTGVACVLEGRRFIGVEKVPAYVAIGRKRIADALASAPLFDHAEQQEMFAADTTEVA